MCLTTLLQKHIDSHQTAGHVWPDDAAFALRYRYHTWPCGWDREAHVQFFETRSQLDSKVQLLKEFAELEDNFVAYQAYEWDLGPKAVPEVAVNLGNLN